MSTKNILCRYYLYGYCNQGSNCRFSHSLDDQPSSICRFYLKGKCPYEKKCRYDHVNPKKGKPNLANNGIDLELVKTNQKSAEIPNVKVSTRPLNADAKEFIPPVSYDPGAMGMGGLSYATALKTNAPLIETNEDKSTLPLCPFFTLYDENESELFDNIVTSNQPLMTTGVVICPYESAGTCGYIHPLACDVCLKRVLHPYNESYNAMHKESCMKEIQMEMEFSFAVQRSAEKTCGICYEKVLGEDGESDNPLDENVNPLSESLKSTTKSHNKRSTFASTSRDKRFGILPNCQHCYCLSCIMNWRQSKNQSLDSETVRSCPECRIQSLFIIPSKVWVEDKTEKDKLIEDYKKSLSEKPCKYFKQGAEKCPMHDICFYKHAYPDGTLATRNPDNLLRRGRRPRNGNNREPWRQLDDVILWDFFASRIFGLDDDISLTDYYDNGESDHSEFGIDYDDFLRAVTLDAHNNNRSNNNISRNGENTSNENSNANNQNVNVNEEYLQAWSENYPTDEQIAEETAAIFEFFNQNDDLNRSPTTQSQTNTVNVNSEGNTNNPQANLDGNARVGGRRARRARRRQRNNRNVTNANNQNNAIINSVITNNSQPLTNSTDPHVFEDSNGDSSEEEENGYITVSDYELDLENYMYDYFCPEHYFYRGAGEDYESSNDNNDTSLDSATQMEILQALRSIGNTNQSGRRNRNRNRNSHPPNTWFNIGNTLNTQNSAIRGRRGGRNGRGHYRGRINNDNNYGAINNQNVSNGQSTNVNYSHDQNHALEQTNVTRGGVRRSRRRANRRNNNTNNLTTNLKNQSVLNSELNTKSYAVVTNNGTSLPNQNHILNTNFGTSSTSFAQNTFHNPNTNHSNNPYKNKQYNKGKQGHQYQQQNLNATGQNPWQSKHLTAKQKWFGDSAAHNELKPKISTESRDYDDNSDENNPSTSKFGEKIDEINKNSINDSSAQIKNSTQETLPTSSKNTSSDLIKNNGNK